MRIEVLEPEFVEFIPGTLADGVLYVSIPYATAVHNCCCGCRQKVVTPLTPTDWALTFDGESVSLYPSIGNWSFECRSHYWVRNGRVTTARGWSAQEIEAGRRRDERRKSANLEARPKEVPEEVALPMGLWSKIKRWFSSRASLRE